MKETLFMLFNAVLEHTVPVAPEPYQTDVAVKTSDLCLALSRTLPATVPPLTKGQSVFTSRACSESRCEGCGDSEEDRLVGVGPGAVAKAE